MPFDFRGEPFSGPMALALIGLGLFLVLVISRIARYAKIVRDRMIAVIIFAFFTVFFWMSFEQGATSLIIFARDSVDRVADRNRRRRSSIYSIPLLTVVPLMIITYVLFLFGDRPIKRVLGSNIVLVICFRNYLGYCDLDAGKGIFRGMLQRSRFPGSVFLTHFLLLYLLLSSQNGGRANTILLQHGNTVLD